MKHLSLIISLLGLCLATLLIIQLYHEPLNNNTTVHDDKLVMHNIHFSISQQKPEHIIKVEAKKAECSLATIILECSDVFCTIFNKDNVIVGYIVATQAQLDTTTQELQFADSIKILNETKETILQGNQAFYAPSKQELSFARGLVANYDTYTCSAQTGSFNFLTHSIILEGNVITEYKQKLTTLENQQPQKSD